MTATLFVVDDDEAMRHSLVFLLKSLGHPVESFASAEAFLAAWRPGMLGCLVLDVRMPGISGLELQRELDGRGDTLSIVFLSGHGDIPMVVRAMRAGAVQFLEKPCNDQVLLDAVTEGLRLSAQSVENWRRTQDVHTRIGQLTPREQAVMRLVVEGKPNKLIAHELDISIKTVEVHRAHVMEKMEAGSVAELTRLLLASQGKP